MKAVTASCLVLGLLAADPSATPLASLTSGSAGSSATPAASFAAGATDPSATAAASFAAGAMDSAGTAADSSRGIADWWGTTCTTAYSYPPNQFTAQAQNQQHCDKVGLYDLQPYRFAGAVASTYFPYFSSVALTKPNPDATQAVVWIHGLYANANKFFCDGVGAARQGGAGDSTVTIAPWFGNQRIAASQWEASWQGGDRMSTCWKEAEWLVGSDVYEAGDGVVSSFTVLDELTELLLDKTNFPNMTKVTFAGFSAGCQMLTRWAVFSSSAKKASVIASDCATYLYFDKQRPAACCSPLSNTGVHHSCDHFVEGNATECPDFNMYKVGLDMSGLPRMSYFSEVAAHEDAMEQRIMDYPKADVRFLLGSADVCQCNVEGFANGRECFPQGLMCWPTTKWGCCDTYPDSSNSNALDFTCGATLEGSNRLQRGLNYISYLKHFFARKGVEIDPIYAFFTGLHNNTAFGLSDIFAEWVGWRPTTIQFTL